MRCINKQDKEFIDLHLKWAADALRRGDDRLADAYMLHAQKTLNNHLHETEDK